MDRRWPLLEAFPSLDVLPRVSLRDRVTPVEHLEAISPRLWVKRDDLTAPAMGGNKVRSLELLLGGISGGEEVVTAGARGSTHALTTAVHARSLGAGATVGWWPQQMNPIAKEVADRLDHETKRIGFPNAALALAWLQWRQWRGARVIPAGGTSPLGILGHVNAAFELAAQIRSGELPTPARVVVPLGTGGTAAGLALGFSLAGVRTTVLAARVVPRIVGRHGRVMRLARAARRLIERTTGHALGTRPVDVAVVQSVYGGAYGRPLEGAESWGDRLAAMGVGVDPTYSAKAFVAAVESAGTAETLFWLTFDSRWITSRTQDGP
ncbi:MAG TPA: pyridoxal-phosphate dependent enzyme [Gemmatimonadaceae bacterium]|nr:pyridoxal-phosphate dependent enzyme [Gemmatimonadaceae bacterium]